MKPGLLLHHCCAPCSVKVIGRLREKFDLKSFWFNPNIYPADENARRRESLLRLASMEGLLLVPGPEYPESLWMDNARSYEGERCRFCYSLRLKETARKAKSLGLKYFSTSLLSSPYQKHDLIRETAAAAAGEEGVEFYYEDFRPYYYEGKNEARKLGFYMQKYCGCVFSKQESDIRYQQKAAKSKT